MSVPVQNQDQNFQCYLCFVFFVFNELRWGEIAHVVAISGIIAHHYLHFIFFIAHFLYILII
jgi:hypothetical protein